VSDWPELSSGYSWHDVNISRRRLEVLAGGPEDGFPLVYHSGTPMGAAPFPMLVDAAAERGFRTITYSRPGYGLSSPAYGRTVSDAAGDTAEVLDSLGHGPATAHDGKFVTCGWSGGGPHTLACAALLADRCSAVAVVAGVAPSDAEGLDWTAGMGDENLVEFELARQGGEDFEALLQFLGDQMKTITEPAGVAEALGDLVTERDKHVIVNDGVGEYMLAGLRQAVLDGTGGWRDDDLAFLTGWGIEIAAIKSPVVIWHGAEDRMVPLAHGHWLAGQVPGARLEVCEGEGHISILPTILPRLLDDLAAALRN
jgi:pimeloyl-ACP methyl ester carboxylesterase